MYSVPIIPNDLRHEETIIQSANALDYLQNVIANVFDRIDERIERNNKKVTELNTRINVATEKIHSLIGINKAIKIFSPAKFPAAHVFRDIPVTFDCNNIEENVKLIEKLETNRNYEILSSQEPIQHKNIQEKLLFYHVRNNIKIDKNRIIDRKSGLGDIPDDIKSINSLLLYNTSENIYESYKNLDIYKKSDRIKPNLQIDTRKLEAPPISIGNRQFSDKRFNQGLFYTPKLNEAPEIDVPDDLPDLPGIADDINFELSDNERIAPSLYFENLPELPDPIGINSPNSKDIPTTSKNINNNLEHSSLAEKSTDVFEHPSAPLPPPPPPLPTVSQLLPPPPPPPPPAVPQTSSPTNLVRVSGDFEQIATAVDGLKTTQPPSLPNAHVNLMEAIRKAGGASGGKLRAAAEIPKKNTLETMPAAKQPSGDLMADLHNKLLMRRKGISGAKDAAATPGNVNVLTTLSALIPAPLTKPQKSSSAADVSDDDDGDDDWAA